MALNHHFYPRKSSTLASSMRKSCANTQDLHPCRRFRTWHRKNIPTPARHDRFAPANAVAYAWRVGFSSLPQPAHWLTLHQRGRVWSIWPSSRAIHVSRARILEFHHARQHRPNSGITPAPFLQRSCICIPFNASHHPTLLSHYSLFRPISVGPHRESLKPHCRVFWVVQGLPETKLSKFVIFLISSNAHI